MTYVKWSDVRDRRQQRAGDMTCAHCRRVQVGRAGITIRNPETGVGLAEMALCHPDYGLDCYRLVTVHGHAMPCPSCRESDHPDRDVCDRCGYRRVEHVVDVEPTDRCAPRTDFLGNPVPCFEFSMKTPRAPF